LCIVRVARQHLSRGVIAAALVLLTTAPAAQAKVDDTKVDIVIAVDTTGSMGPSIGQARRDAHQIVDDTRDKLPNAQFAIIDFKDSFDTPEYLVRRPMTASADEVAAAIDQLEADGGGDSPEAYNLLFAKAVDDPEIAFRDGARRIMFVIGDAEPHGAGNSELPGCSDDSEDPHGLATHSALSTLRKARITMNMILQRSSAQTTLRCYRSLARLSYGGGQAIASGGRGGKGELAKLLARALARELPAVGWTPPSRVEPGKVATYSILVRNRTPEPVMLRNLWIDPPKGFTYDPKSTRGLSSDEPGSDRYGFNWGIVREIPAGRRRSLTFGLKAPDELRGSGKVKLRAEFQLPDGGLYVAEADVELPGEGKP
jgi:Mg-chelatase subunit ChlD